MNTLFVIIAVAVMFVVVLLLVSKLFGKKSNRPKRKKSTTANANPVTTQWRAVKIAPGLMSCSAVQKMAYTKFLSRDCPSLPLQNCSQRECQCKYVHLEDRRGGGDRRIDLGELGKFLPSEQIERRQVMGRRTIDLGA